MHVYTRSRWVDHVQYILNSIIALCILCVYVYNCMIVLVCIIHRAPIVSQLLAVNAIKVIVKVHRISSGSSTEGFQPTQKYTHECQVGKGVDLGIKLRYKDLRQGGIKFSLSPTHIHTYACAKLYMRPALAQFAVNISRDNFVVAQLLPI